MDSRFKEGHYEVTQLIEPNVIEVNGTWFVKIRGVDEGTVPDGDRLSNWLRVGNPVLVIPHYRLPDARIVSDVWLGRIHINRSFSNYKEESQSA